MTSTDGYAGPGSTYATGASGYASGSTASPTGSTGYGSASAAVGSTGAGGGLELALKLAALNRHLEGPTILKA